MTKRKSKKPDWVAIRREAEATKEPMAVIARRHGIAPRTLYRRRKVWQQQDAQDGQDDAIMLREGGKSDMDLPDANLPDANLPDADLPGADHVAMVQRLYNAADQQIRHLESKLASGEAAYDEKEARMLGTIARTLDKLMELTNVGEATASKTGQTGHKSKAGQKSKRGAENSSHDEKAIDDAVSQQTLDDLRADLAQRLEALQQGAKSPVPVRPEQA